MEHAKYYAWHMARAQANYRKEPWNMTFADWQQAWGDQWHLRGRHSGDLCMLRRDWQGAWQLDNVMVVPREQLNERQRLLRRLKRTRRLDQ